MFVSSSVLINTMSKRLNLSKIVFLNGSKALLDKTKVYGINSDRFVRLLSTSVESECRTYDVVVSGGGLVGSAMACALAASDYMQGKKILLLDGGPPIQPLVDLSEKYSNRVSSINPGSIQMLNELGVWKNVGRSKNVKRIQMWEALAPSTISFQQEHMESDVFSIVENHVLLGALTSRLAELPAEVMYSVKVTKYTLPQKPDDLVNMELQDGSRIKTKFLIGADGFSSLVRHTMGVHYVSWSYNQHAIVATLKLHDTVENNVAFQKFLPTGPVALLPVTNDLSSLVWTVTPSMAESLMGMPDDQFTDQLNAALWSSDKRHPLVEKAAETVKSCLDTFLPNSGSIVQLPPSILEVEPKSRASFPLGLGHSSSYVKHRCALIGDAAHRVHPLAGLGVNLGFGDVKSLTEVLEKSVRNGSQLGDFLYLKEYETERQQHNIPIMAAIDGLNKLYSTTFLPIILMRSIGLQIVDAATPLKNQCIKMASR